MVKPQGIDVALCEQLVERAIAGDEAAKRDLVEHLWPTWLAQARGSKSMGSLSRSEDHVREVATRIAERLGRKRAHGLRLYSHWRKAHADKDFGDWVRVVEANVIRDYVREQIGNVRLADGEISRKRLLNEFTKSLVSETPGFRPPYTAKQAARQIVEFARAHLPHAQLRAIDLWLEGKSDEDLDRELETQPGGGRDLRRAGIAVLRRRFAGVTG